MKFLTLSFVALSTALFCSTDSDWKETAKTLLEHAEQGNSDAIADSFEEIARRPANAEETLEDIRDLLQAFIQEMNEKYQLTVTLSDVCQIARLNLDQFEIPEENRELFLMGLDIIETGDQSKLALMDNLLKEAAQKVN